MKPTKNRIYCNDCGHTKMLFTEKSKADNFIKFNAEEMEEEGNKVPVRSYFCSTCGGWHVTSNPDADSFANGSWYEHIIARITKTQPQCSGNSKMKELIQLALDGLTKAEEMLASGNADKAKASAFQWIKTLKENGVKNSYPYNKANLLIAKAACAMIMEVDTLLSEAKTKAAISKVEKIEECMKQIADDEALADYRDTLTKAMSTVYEKLADNKRCDEMQKNLLAIRKEVNIMKHSLRWASLCDLLCDIPVLTQRLTEIDQNCVSHDIFRDVVCQLYDIREQLNASLDNVA